MATYILTEKGQEILGYKDPKEMSMGSFGALCKALYRKWVESGIIPAEIRAEKRQKSACEQWMKSSESCSLIHWMREHKHI